MGLFSLFTKKPDDEPVASDLPRRAGAEPTRLPRDIEAERARQREIARATAAKIDAIEYAMTFEIFNGPDTTMAAGSAAARATPDPAASPRQPAAASANVASPAAAPGRQDQGASTVLRGGPNSGLDGLDDDIEPTLLLPDDDAAADATPPSPAIEESAILYANGQQEAAELLLRDAVCGPDGEQRALWAMLFDLYQASGNRAGFEHLAMDFAGRFETSPPSWMEPAPPRPLRQRGPSAALAGSLDDQCAAALDGLLAQAPGNSVLQLDVSGVTFIHSDACTHLLAALDRLRELDIELVLVGTEALLQAVEQRTRVGERGSGPAPWLLRLALLQLTAQDEAFDQVAMDYCITHEVSPPSYVAPPRVTIAGAPEAAEVPRQYRMPALLDQGQLEAIGAHAALADVVEFDCSGLARADYATATALMGQLRAIRAEGHAITFHELNHLVAALFRLIGIDGLAQLHTRKY